MPPDDDIRERLRSIEDKLNNISSDLGALKGAMHLPSDCPLSDRLAKVELETARRAGSLAVYGAIAGIVSGAMVAAVIKLLFNQ